MKFRIKNRKNLRSTEKLILHCKTESNTPLQSNYISILKIVVKSQANSFEDKPFFFKTFYFVDSKYYLRNYCQI